MPANGILNEYKLEASKISFSTRFNSVLMAIDDPVRALAMELPSSSAVESHDWLGTVPGLTEWKDERRLSELRAENITIANRDWSSGIRINANDIADDRLGMIRPRIDMLANKAALHYGEIIVDAMIQGFVTTSEYGTAYDGKAFFATDHQEGDGPVQSNKGTAAFAEAAFFSARAQMRSLTDENSDPLGIIPNTLVCGPDNEQAALQVLNAELVPDGAGAGITNVARGLANLVISPRLVGGNANYWFLADLTAPVRPMILQIREALSTDFVGDGSLPRFMRKQLLFGAEGRHNVGYGLWQHVFGSDGTT